MDDGCTCHVCGEKYRVDILVSDKLWTLLSGNADGSELWCGRCIVDGLERMGFGAFTLAALDGALGQANDAAEFPMVDGGAE